LADATPERFWSTLLPTMFSDGTAQEVLDESGSSMQSFHPAGFRAMARACAEDLRDALPHGKSSTPSFATSFATTVTDHKLRSADRVQVTGFRDARGQESGFGPAMSRV
jgi:hypothetical protein